MAEFSFRVMLTLMIMFMLMLTLMMMLMIMLMEKVCTAKIKKSGIVIYEICQRTLSKSSYEYNRDLVNRDLVNNISACGEKQPAE